RGKRPQRLLRLRPDERERSSSALGNGKEVPQLVRRPQPRRQRFKQHPELPRFYRRAFLRWLLPRTTVRIWSPHTRVPLQLRGTTPTLEDLGNLTEGFGLDSSPVWRVCCFSLLEQPWASGSYQRVRFSVA
ncbi:hypothetical protein, partial [Thermogutta sp.]|uniref:hypothetical protein n=1 Tax=Thermogutta sp. TaxID=1962930 RepID=UPI00321FBE70